MTKSLKIEPSTIQDHQLIKNQNTIQEKLFKNQDVYLIGGGPSLINFDFNRLQGKNIIVINKAMYYIPWAQVLYFSDYRFYLWNKDDIENFKGKVFTIATKAIHPNITILKSSGRHGIDLREGYIKDGGNSGFAALGLAHKLGAKRIILLGYDMSAASNGKTHFHDGYKIEQAKTIYKGFKEPFERIAEEYKKLNILIYNTNINSELNCFPKLPIENFL